MINLNHQKHIDLIYSELVFQKSEFEKLLKKYAAKMFINKQLFIARFLGYDNKRGNILLKFDLEVCLPPRKNEVLLCFISELQDNNVKNWGALTYHQLRSKCLKEGNEWISFEARTVFYEYEEKNVICGISGIKENNVKHFKKGDLVFLAPNDPPLTYLINLHTFLLNTNSTSDSILNINLDEKQWKPFPIEANEEIVNRIQLDLIENDLIIIQGPPGTGKTYLMAKLCQAFLNGNFKILVTALTNRALIELAEKEFLEEKLKQGCIYKTALTADERNLKKLTGIKSFKSLKEQDPPLLLASYFSMSQMATEAFKGQHFDYIIIEEASQAYLSTIALARKLGKKCIVVGDIKQLEPIFKKKYTKDDPDNYHFMVCGLKAVSFFYKKSKQYILTNSYRLNRNSVKCTNAFYKDQLISKSKINFPISFPNNKLSNILNVNGGVSVKLFDLSSGKSPSIESINFFIETVSLLNDYKPDVSIAILSFYRETVRNLQSNIFKKFKSKNNILIDTVDRIQGMTTEYCFYFVPLESFPFSLDENRFNVATSRARYNTIIVADNSIYTYLSNLNTEVSQYFNRLTNK